LNITFYNPLFFTTTAIHTFTAESTAFSPDDYQYLFDRKTTLAPSGVLYLDFGSTQTVDALVYDRCYAAEVYAKYNASADAWTETAFNFFNFYSGTITAFTTSSFVYADRTSTSFILNFTTATAYTDKMIIGWLGATIGGFVGSVQNIIPLERIFELDENPDASDFKISIKSVEILHKIADGGVKKGRLAESARYSIALDYVSNEGYEKLYNLYEQNKSFFIVHNPSSSAAWVPLIHEVNWLGDFTFEEYTDNFKGNGWRGNITLAEVPR